MNKAVNIVVKLSQLSGRPRKFSGVEGCMMHVAPPITPLRHHWTILH